MTFYSDFRYSLTNASSSSVEVFSGAHCLSVVDSLHLEGSILAQVEALLVTFYPSVVSLSVHTGQSKHSCRLPAFLRSSFQC